MAKFLHTMAERDLSFRFRARGLSMHPFIRDNDVVTVSPPSDGSPRFGNVVAFIQPQTGKLALHRVVGKRHEDCLIKGDAIAEPDGFLPNKGILGYVTKVERDGKEVLLCLGPGKSLIAFFSRTGLFSHLLFPVWKFFRP